MVTGGKGVHVIAPLTPQAEWPEVKDFAHRLAQAVAQSDPDNFTAALPKAQRKGRIFVDYLRNQRGATAVMPYSVRARENAPVAAPITWKEMETIDTPAHLHVGDAAELREARRVEGAGGLGPRRPGAAGPVKIATYNVNGVNGRLPVLLRWLDGEPARHRLPAGAEGAAGEVSRSARSATPATTRSGTARRAGTASRSSAASARSIETRRGLPGDPDDTHSRYIEAAVNGILIGGLYLPNGNPRPGPKFDYKLRWFERLIEHAAGLLESGLPVVLAGDYNVMPTERDVYKPERWLDDALFAPEVRAAFFRLLDQGWTDALRTLHPDETIYTFWDYFRNAYAPQRRACGSTICC